MRTRAFILVTVLGLFLSGGAFGQAQMMADLDQAPPGSYDMMVAGEEAVLNTTVFAHEDHPTEGWVLLVLRGGSLARLEDGRAGLLPVKICNGNIFDIDWHPSGDYAMGMCPNATLAKYFPDNHVEYIPTPATGMTRAIEFSPDGSQALAVGFAGTAVLYHHGSNQVDDVAYGGDGYFMNDVAWHPSGSYALISGIGPYLAVDYKLMRFQEGEWFVVHRAKTWDWMWSISFHPDGDYALIGGCELNLGFMGCKQARVWTYRPGFPVEAMLIYEGEEHVMENIYVTAFDDQGRGYVVRYGRVPHRQIQLMRTEDGFTIEDIGTPWEAGSKKDLTFQGDLALLTGDFGMLDYVKDGVLQERVLMTHMAPDVYIDWPDEIVLGQNVSLRSWVIDPDGWGAYGRWNITEKVNWTLGSPDANGTFKWLANSTGKHEFSFTGVDSHNGFTEYWGELEVVEEGWLPGLGGLWVVVVLGVCLVWRKRG